VATHPENGGVLPWTWQTRIPTNIDYAFLFARGGMGVPPSRDVPSPVLLLRLSIGRRSLHRTSPLAHPSACPASPNCKDRRGRVRSGVCSATQRAVTRFPFCLGQGSHGGRTAPHPPIRLLPIVGLGKAKCSFPREYRIEEKITQKKKEEKETTHAVWPRCSFPR
jgi:hypothetical protein